MKILLSPQVRYENKIWYEVEKNIITAFVNDDSDVFDFSNLPNGRLKLYDEDGKELIETDLPENPILQAEKVDGELFVEILFTIDSDEEDERLLFPEEMNLQEFNELMDEISKREKEEEIREELPPATLDDVPEDWSDF